MADPVSLTASCLAIIGAATKIGLCLYTITENVRDVDDSVKALCNEAESLKRAAADIRSTLAKHPILLRGPSSDLWMTMGQQIKDCVPTLQSMETMLGEVQRETALKKGILRRPMTAASLAKRMKSITSKKDELRTYSLALQMGLINISICMQHENGANIRGDIRSIKRGMYEGNANIQGHLASLEARIVDLQSTKSHSQRTDRLLKSAKTFHASTSASIREGSVLGEPLTTDEFDRIHDWIPSKDSDLHEAPVSSRARDSKTLFETGLSNRTASYYDRISTPAYSGTSTIEEPIPPVTSSTTNPTPPSWYVDDVIDALLAVRGHPPGKKIQLEESKIHSLCTDASNIFLSQPPLLELDAPVKVIGDIHGHYHDLLQYFEYGGYPPAANYLFLGNYVDRGKQSLETICLLFAYKIKFPETFFLLRGNHECASMNRIWGFYDECKRRYGVKLWKSFIETFDCMPIAALVNDEILAAHGGFSPHLDSLQQIRNIRRPIDIPARGLLHDLLWPDDDKHQTNWSLKVKGASCTYEADILSQFLQKHNLRLLVRAHQVVEDDYEFLGDRHLVTLFSATKYGSEIDHSGAMMIIPEDLMWFFKIIEPGDIRGSKKALPVL